MGIAGSIVDHNFFESRLGNESPCGGYDRTASPYRSGRFTTKPNWKWRWPADKKLPLWRR
ncbi:hypothetical protein DMI62_15125 [Escherichia coli]|nr:hypothetical protein [Escherichia coli]